MTWRLDAEESKLGVRDVTSRRSGWTACRIIDCGDSIKRAGAASCFCDVAATAEIYTPSLPDALRKQLGLGDTTDRCTATAVTINLSSVNIGKVAAGNSLSFEASIGGQAWAFGIAGHGQLGLGDNTTRYPSSAVTT